MEFRYDEGSKALQIRNALKSCWSAPMKNSLKDIISMQGFGINSILFQRGVYPEEFFIKENKYDLTV
ncbi:MAD2L1 [Cordylochernes scorpioides]|uniref:MAD2L1 n=1 Tax=Cordylochernes scorpioides TaxID=51811 RepID=A0ABY6LT50_9ARAC|nr:MAD2L1 [Cordylochernes scorpioides]